MRMYIPVHGSQSQSTGTSSYELVQQQQQQHLTRTFWVAKSHHNSFFVASGRAAPLKRCLVPLSPKPHQAPGLALSLAPSLARPALTLGQVQALLGPTWQLKQERAR